VGECDAVLSKATVKKSKILKFHAWDLKRLCEIFCLAEDRERFVCSKRRGRSAAGPNTVVAAEPAGHVMDERRLEMAQCREVYVAPCLAARVLDLQPWVANRFPSKGLSP
jgi:hypothetical protein